MDWALKQQQFRRLTKMVVTLENMISNIGKVESSIVEAMVKAAHLTETGAKIFIDLVGQSDRLLIEEDDGVVWVKANPNYISVPDDGLVEVADIKFLED